MVCDHCGRTDHGFACCGTLLDPCPIDHTTPPAPASGRRQRGPHGPARPLRPPRRLDPRGARR